MLSVTTELASHAFGSADSADSPSSSAVMSADGRYVAFLSSATNLVSGVNIVAGVQNVYRYDHLTGEVVLVSVDNTGTTSGNYDCKQPVISADGNVIAFSTGSTNFSPLDASTNLDVYARNIAAGTTELVSVNSTGDGSGNGHSDYPVISADGNRIAFRSTAWNIDPLDHDTLYDIYVRDLTTDATQLVSVNALGTGSGNRPTYTPLISANGNVVTFLTQSSNISPLDTGFDTQLFARNLALGTTTLVSVNATGDGPANDPVGDPSLSADGSRIAFTSTATNLDPLDKDIGNERDYNSDVFVRDLNAGITHLVSVNGAGTTSGNDESFDPSLSADGTVVAFTSLASDLLPNLQTEFYNIFARDLVTGTTLLVSMTLAGTGVTNREFCWNPVISADGKVVVFESDASNLDPLDTDFDLEDDMDVFARNLSTGKTYLVSVNAASNNAGNGPSSTVAVNSDGTQVVLLSAATDLAGVDNNAAQDVFVATLDWALPALPGDYNHDGVVDAADFIVVRSTLGTSVAPYSGADGDGNGVVDAFDVDVWRVHFGETIVAPAIVEAGAADLQSAASEVRQELANTTNQIRLTTPVEERGKEQSSRALHFVAHLTNGSHEIESVRSFRGDGRIPDSRHVVLARIDSLLLGIAAMTKGSDRNENHADVRDLPRGDGDKSEVPGSAADEVFDQFGEFERHRTMSRAATPYV